MNYKIDDNQGCECKLERDSVCELWVSLAFSNDLAPQLGIQHDKKTIDNLDTRVEEITKKIFSNFKNDDSLGIMNESSKQDVMTNKKLIEIAISQMDTERLKQLLSDDYLYSEWNKEDFIETLEVAAFSAFRANGDTFLKPYSGSCKCCENRSCRGIAFIGNKSKDVLNIVFEENELEFTDIISCGSFKTLEEVETNNIQCIPTLTDSNSEFLF